MTGRRRRGDRPHRLRIGAVVTGLALNGGLERCVLEDTTDLVAAGHEVEIWHRDAHAPRSDEGRAPFDRMGVRLVDATDYHFGVRTALRDAVRFAREGLRLRRSHLDVLWLNRPEYLPFGRIASLVAGVPLAVHLHHAPNYRRIRAFSGGRTQFFAVSQAMASAWRDAGAPADHVTIVPNGVDTDAFPAATPADVRRARSTLGIDDDTPTVLYYGRLSRSKGVLALLEAWGRVLTIAHARLPETVPAGSDAPRRPPLLVLAGALYPSEADAVEEAIAALPEGSVLVLPERDDVVPLLHAADLVVAPSIEPEGFGRVVVEAMSTGRPVVAAESGGTGEILSGEWARFTVDPTDPEALARKVLDALEEAAQDPSLGDRCRDFVREHHGRGPHVATLLRALTEHAAR
ncbi:glycosyltransferase family 4 protein [Curtobacterium sp. SP.BCo]|uniref:glycosyltransferase family 4 protein n=1 Tax=Curtobacterium sp. SP.BCo TaxID=3435229 RepID=UPI003F739020